MHSQKPTYVLPEKGEAPDHIGRGRDRCDLARYSDREGRVVWIGTVSRSENDLDVVGTHVSAVNGREGDSLRPRAARGEGNPAWESSTVSKGVHFKCRYVPPSENALHSKVLP